MNRTQVKEALHKASKLTTLYHYLRECESKNELKYIQSKYTDKLACQNAINCRNCAFSVIAEAQKIDLEIMNYL